MLSRFRAVAVQKLQSSIFSQITLKVAIAGFVSTHTECYTFSDYMDSIILVFAALLLVFLNGFFVAAEFALVKVRATRIEELISQGRRSGRVAKRLHGKLDAALSASQLGITLASLGLGWIGEPAFAHLIERLIGVGPWSTAIAHTFSITLAFLLITALHIVFGEQAPKTIGIRNAERTLLWVARPLDWFYRAAYPLIWLLNSASVGALKLAGIRSAEESERAHSEEELRMILTQSKQSGVITSDEHQLMESIFDFGDRTARQVMVPRSDIISLTTEKSYEDNVKLAREHEHTRYPLCEKNIDQIIGMVNVKDLLFNADRMDIRSLRRDILFVPEMKSLKDLLREFQKTHLHMAIVVDEYGSTAGLVTLEDILEELIGEIQDEYDIESPKFQRLSDRAFRVAGNLLLDELEDKLKIEIEDEENETVAGHVMARLGRPARVGDTVDLDSYKLRVTRVDGFRINELLLEKSQTGESVKV